MVAVLKYIQSESTEIGCELGERNFKVYIDFLFSTFLQHIKLFQFVFTRERERMSPNVQLEIIPPKSSEPLKEAKEVKIWDYQQNYEGLQRKETEKQNERLLKKQCIAETADKRLEESMKKIESKKEEKFTKEVSNPFLIIIFALHTDFSI